MASRLKIKDGEEKEKGEDEDMVIKKIGRISTVLRKLTCAKPKKKSWSPVYPANPGKVPLTVADRALRFWYAL